MRLLKRLAAAAVLVVVLAASAGLAILAEPELVVNGRTAGWALQRFGKSYAPRWNRLAVGVDSAGLFDKTLDVDASAFCLSGKTPPWSACFERLHVRLGARFSTHGIEELRLAELDVLGGPVRADLSRPAPAKPGGPVKAAPPGLPRWFSALRIGRLDVALPDNRIKLATGTLSGTATVKLPLAGKRSLSVLVDAARARVITRERVTVDARIATDLWDGRATRLDVDAKVSAGSLGRATARARARPLPGGKLSLSARASVEARGKSLRLSVAGSGDRSTWSTALDAGYRDPAGALHAAGVDDCRVDLGFAERELRLESGKIHCRYFVEPKPFGEQTPKRLSGLVDAHGSAKPGRDLDAGLTLTVDPTGDWYRFSGRLSATASGKVGGVNGLRLSHDADLTISVPQFERLVDYFHATVFALPAPLNSMRGPITLRLKGSGDSRRDPQRFELTGLTAIGDGVQSVRTRLTGEILARDPWTPKRRFEATLLWDLLDVSLQLPYLELQAPPKVTVDPRIQSHEKAPIAASAQAEGENLRMAPAAKPRPLPFTLTARVRTPDKPIRLHTNLIRDPVPLRVSADVHSPGAAEATVSAEPFEIQLFRRKALVERFVVGRSSGPKSATIDAAFLYQSNDATIRILVLGTTDKPRVQFQSDPPMDRSHILGLLLFGKQPSELESDEAASVGHTNAALTEQAFGLASLFVFASTPIDYVGYNPDTQSYVVRFRLPGGATAELGSDLEERRRLRVRKRLARNWALETELRREASTDRNAVTTFLEWFRRY